MSIIFYRNILNSNVKKFGKFSKKVVANLKAEGTNVNIIYDAKKEYCLDQIKEHDTIIIISHGSSNGIFHRFDHKYERHQMLLNNSNGEILKGKKVIAISCGTAKKFGKTACTKLGCKAYLGFYNKIHFDKLNRKNTSMKYSIFVGDCYKDTFANIIELAIRNSWTFDKIQTVLSIELRKTVTNRAIDIQKSRPHYFKNHGLDQAVLAITNVAENIIVYGDPQEIII